MDQATVRLVADRRFVLVLGSAFVLQLMHPTVGAGIADRSTFMTDPWGRFFRSWNGLVSLLGDPDRAARAQRLRAAHADISGTDARGRPYHAHDHEACWWVLATGVRATLEFARLIGAPPSDTLERRVLGAYRELALVYGIEARAVPRTPVEFRAWWPWMLAERLEDGPTVHTVLNLARRPPAPARAPELLWRPAAPALGHLVYLATVATLPDPARERLGLRMTASARAQFGAILAVARAAGA